MSQIYTVFDINLVGAASHSVDSTARRAGAQRAAVRTPVLAALCIIIVALIQATNMASQSEWPIARACLIDQLGLLRRNLLRRNLLRQNICLQPQCGPGGVQARAGA